MPYGPNIDLTPTTRWRQSMALLDLQGLEFGEAPREGDLSNLSVLLCV